MQDNYLKLNQDKTEIVFIGRKNQLNRLNINDISISNNAIPISSAARDLGLHIDEQLSFAPHINHISKACFYNIHIIWKIRKYLDISSTKIIVHSLILSRLDYCNSCLNGITKRQLRKLQKIQNSSARLIYKKPNSCHTTPLLKKLHWLPVHLRIQYKLCLTVYKCIHHQAPLYLQELFTPSANRRYPLRSDHNSSLKIPNIMTSQGRRAISYAGPKLWNSLPPHVRHSPTLSTFSSKLKTHLFTQF